MRAAAQRRPEPAAEIPLWLIEPAAAPDDPWWQGRPIWQLLVAAPSAAFARLEAERWALRLKRFVPVGNESSSMNAGFIDAKLYCVHALPDDVDPGREAFSEASVMVLAGPMASGTTVPTRE